MQTVLITALGSAAAISCVKSLQNSGIRVIGCDLFPREWNEASLQVDAFFEGSTVNDPDYGGKLCESLKKYHADALIPLTDPEVDYWSAHRADAACTICVPSAETERLCRDKLKMSVFLKQNKLCDTIPTNMATDWIPEDNDFPVLLKPREGRSSQGQRIVNSLPEYREAVKIREDYVAQPYCPGLIHTVDVARDSFGNTTSLCRAELLRTVNGLGTTVKILPGHPLGQICEKIASAVDYLGVCNMEFIERNGQYLFLEVNPRFSGGIGFSIASGVDFARLMLDCHLGRKIRVSTVPRECMMTRRIEPIISFCEQD